MATKLNQAFCFSSQSNVGRGPCAFEPGIDDTLIFIPKSKVFTAAEVLALQATLTALYANDNKALRAVPVGTVFEFAPKNTDPVKQTSKSTGRVKTVRRGKMGTIYTISNAGLQYHGAVLALSGQQNAYAVLRFDDKQQLRGVTRNDATGKPGMGGFYMEDLYVSDYEVTDGSIDGQFMIDIQWADAMEHTYPKVAFTKIDFHPINDMTIVDEVELTNLTITGGTANIALIGATYSGGNDLTAIHSTDIAKPGAWDWKDATSGASVTPTAVSTIAGSGFSFTFTSQTGNTLVGKLKVLSALAALTPAVYGIESSNGVTVLIP